MGVDWFGASSWLGGAPQLGRTPWPRDKRGEPLHFVALSTPEQNCIGRPE